MVLKEFRIIVDVEEEDFCLLDLKECIIDGADNIGNHTVKDVIESEETRVYLVNGYDTSSNYEEAIMEEAERLGTVYSLDNFQSKINDDTLRVCDCFILIR
jgi:hypothetical protein